MGYTHYFENKETLNEEGFSRAASILKYIYHNRKRLLNDDVVSRVENNQYFKDLSLETKIEIVEEFDNDKEPVFTNNLIRFNGKGDWGHETFYITPTDEGFQFCKTNRKPYDFYAVAALGLLKAFCKEQITISSDGGSEVESILEVVKEILDKELIYTPDFPVTLSALRAEDENKIAP